jgi:hypothetical protein
MAERKLKNLINLGGLCVATAYMLVVILVFVVTAVNTKPSNVGLDWIPFVLLAMPWYAMNPQLLLPGMAANAAIMYLLGTVLQTFWRRVILR